MKSLILSILILSFSTLVYTQGESLFVPEYKPYGIPFGDRITSFDLIDLNNDNFPDAVASIVRNDTSMIVFKLGPDLSTLIDNPNFVFKFSSPNPRKKNSFYVAWSDIDMDGDQDVYLGEHAEHNLDAKIYILENKTTGSLLFELNNTFVFDIEDIIAVPSPIDFDDDGKEDLFVSDYTGHIHIYKNNGEFSFTQLNTSMGLNDLQVACSFDELSNSRNLLSYDAINGFDIFLFDGTTYTRDTLNDILSDPDYLNALFYQPRIRDLNNDDLPDAFLSSNTFSVNNSYYSDSWLYQGICVDTLYKNEIPVINATYSASNLITSAGEIDSPLGVTYKAGNSIELNPNFTIKAGALFEAIIQDCPGQ